MSETPTTPLRIAVIGGGISGLAASHRLHTRLPQAEIRLFESSARLGGSICTEHRHGLVFEHGADSFLAKTPTVVDLCGELGLADQLIPTNSAHRRALVVCRGRLEPVPVGFVLMRPNKIGAVLRSPVLSLPGKLRLYAERLVRAPADAALPGHDESVASFATRRLGREAYERLVQPLVAGVYVADAAKLSMAATQPEFLEAERLHGSLRRSVGKRPAAPQGWAREGTHSAGPVEPRDSQRDAPQDSGARYSAFLTLRNGMGALVDALAAALPAGSLRLNTRVDRLARTGDGSWAVSCAGNEDKKPFAGVVLALPAPRAGQLLATVDPRLSQLVEGIECASSAVVTLVYRPTQFARPLDSFGLVVPHIERRSILAASFPGMKFPGRSSAELVPIRVFTGGALQPALVELADDELVDIAGRELSQLLGVPGGPVESSVARWRQAMPQYHVGHVQRVVEIDRCMQEHHGLALAGNAYRGVGISQCIAGGRAAADRIAGR